MKILPFILMFALINSCIELEISAPSFPDVMNYFNVGEDIVGLTITLNLIGFCISSIFYGPLSDSIGRRRTMLIGNAILVIGAVGCTIAPSIHFLLLSRFIQGIGAATSAVVVSAIVADTYEAKTAAKLYGVMNAVFTSLMALSPLIGGFINEMIGWRGNYGTVALICIISWCLLSLFLQETNKNFRKLEMREVAKNYRFLFTSPLFIAAASVPSMLYGCYMSFIAISPFIYMQVYHLSMVEYTFHIALVVACLAIASAVSGKVTDVLGERKMVKFALILQMTASLIMCAASNINLFTYGMGIFSISFALIYPILFARSMEIFPEMKGVASSAIMCSRYFICSGLTAIASFSYSNTSLSLALVILCTSMIVFLVGSYLLRVMLYEKSIGEEHL